MNQLNQFHKELKRIQGIQGIDTDWVIGSKELSDIIKKQLLTYDDIMNNPEKFFAFHAAISEYDGLHGFGIRFTVQYNLFAGSLIALGVNQYHKNTLLESQSNGSLGCFMLTEYGSGVLSGMICNTVATICDDGFMINTSDIIENSDGSINFVETTNCKNWISQGLSAKYGIVIARLIIDSHDCGIHPFLIEINQNKGIYLKSNGEKTIAKSLDNAMVVFKNLKIPSESLMYDLSKENIESLKQNPNIGFKRIASRLNSGRLCIALSMSRYLSTQLNNVKSNSLNKMIYVSRSKQQALSSLPEIQYILDNNSRILGSTIKYIDWVVSTCCQKIKLNEQFNSDLLENIIVAKIIVVNFGYKMMNELKIRMGANSLFAEKGMGSVDILLCARFAEGDNDVLLEKLLIDRIKDVIKKPIKFHNYLAHGFKATMGSNKISKEKILIIQLLSLMKSNKSNKTNEKSLSIISKSRECKNRIIYNIVNRYSENSLTLQDIQIML